MQPKQTTSLPPNERAAASNEAAPQMSPSGGKITLAEPQGQGQTQEEARGAFWKTRFGVAETNQQPMHAKWGDWYKQMYAGVESSDMAAWRSKVFLPIIAGKVWDLIARFIQYKPGWDVSIRSIPKSMDTSKYAQYVTEMNVKYDKVKLKMDYDYDNPLRDTPIQDELQSVMLDATVTGTGLARVPYDTKIVEDKEHVQRGEMLDMSLEQITTTHQGYNGFEAVNIFNFYKSPGGKSLQGSGWIIIKDYVALSELQRRANYKNLDRIKGGGVSDATAQYQKTKNLILSNPDQVSLDDTLNLVETYECYDKESKMVSIYASQGGNFVEIFRQPNIFWHGKYPFQDFKVRSKPHQFWGESLFENSETLQAAINDAFNHYMDSLNMSDGMMAIEEGSSVEPFIVEPGGEFRYRGEAPKQWKFPEPNPAQLSTIMGQIMQAIEAATLSNYASGATNSATDQTQGTFGGIQRLMEAAAEKVGMMRANFRRSFNGVGNIWLSNTQQFMDSDVVVPTKKNGQEMPEVIRPIDLAGLFNLKIEDGSFEPVSKDEQRKNYMDYVANITSWAAASVEQSQRTQGATPALNLDFNSIAMRGSEVYGENFNNFVLADPTGAITQAQAQPPVDPIMAQEQMLAGNQNGMTDAEALTPTAPEGVAANESVQPANFGIATPDTMTATTPQMAFA